MCTNKAANVAAIDTVDWVTGPGRFLTIWVQGCDRGCPGCVNETYQPLEAHHLLTVEKLLNWLTPDLDGICFSGGEPMLQAHALVPLAAEAANRGLGVVSYSGYTLAEIRTECAPCASALLAYLDILIDGPFIREMAAPRLWCGSSNQEIHFLTPRYDASVLDHAPVSLVRITSRQSVAFGTPNEGLCSLLTALNHRGIDLNT